MGCGMIVVFIIAVFASAGWLFLSNLSNICFVLMMLCYLISGIFIFGSGIKKCFFQKESVIFYKRCFFRDFHCIWPGFYLEQYGIKSFR